MKRFVLRKVFEYLCPGCCYYLGMRGFLVSDNSQAWYACARCGAGGDNLSLLTATEEVERRMVVFENPLARCSWVKRGLF